MREEIRDQWVADLRSGDFPQGKNKLHSLDMDGVSEFCCLGVLCERAVEAGVVERVRYRNPDGTKASFYAYVEPDAPEGEGELYGNPGLYSNYLPPLVAEWADLGEDHNPRVTVKDTGHSNPLSTLNDEGSSFESIAKLIEEQF